MINFRFHIVSLTAVFLAFAIGLVLGTSFLDDASERLLKRQLDELDANLTDARAQNADQGARIDSDRDEAEALDQQLGERLFDGQLDGTPVLVVSTRGLDSDVVQRVLGAVDQANGDLLGVWWLTDRLALDDDDEVADLATSLDVEGEEPDELRSTLAEQLSAVLLPRTDAGAGGAVAGAGSGSGPGSGPAAGEPDLLGALHDGGFVDYELPEDSDADVVSLPASGLRIVVVSGQDIAVPETDVLVPLLSDMSAEGPVPVVVAAPTPTSSGDDDPVDPGTVDGLVAAVRSDDALKAAMSTVDDLERVAGRVAVVLATEDAIPGAEGGHYGLGDGAQRVLPPPSDEEGS
jgi:hypothetical protein